MPGKHDPLSAAVVLKHLLQAHQLAYPIIHNIQPDARVGLAHAFTPFKVPGIDRVLLHLDRRSINWAGKQDFIGVNYYRPIGGVINLPKSDLGWAVYPQGLYQVLNQLKGIGLPLYVTENGIADADDDQRADYIADHLFAVWRALQEGADVRGYFHWSLLDNFEWAKGFEPRFGRERM